ncbi:MAG: NAD-dependent epimerase/dehydratase family protein [Proteobacteria bacterium]|nr:NAD-dependent epimerase/dehydratase family protein [Pseudomonadota bacterium]
MSDTKKRIFLTGATGNMGSAGLRELLAKSDRFDVVVLALPTANDKKILAPYDGKIKIVWGDLTNYDNVLEGVNGADYVLHVGGMVSPKADYFPQTTYRVNVTAAQNIVRAVLAQPLDRQPKVVYIGSVAQLGARNEPVHWGRTGDPIQISIYDHYAISKTVAERTFAESGIKKWVSLRQSGILYPGILKNYDPIMFHVPIRGVLEWATVEDSGRLLANICDLDLPDTFWNRFYNIGSGPEYRLSNYEFECLLLKAISCPPPEKIFNANWFVLRNFHGHWYEDSDVLENYLHFRANTPVKAYFEEMGKSVPWFYHLSKLCPPPILKLAMRPMAYKKAWGTQDWIAKRDENRISAYYGSYEKWAAIPNWKDWDVSHPSNQPVHLSHGYDEEKSLDKLDIEDMRQAAAFRGGQCLSESMTPGDLRTPLEWSCYAGHHFKASPTLVLLGGHWCPDCLPMPWKYDEIARNNPFFAQVWYAAHDKDENYIYDSHIFDGWENAPKALP